MYFVLIYSSLTIPFTLPFLFPKSPPFSFMSYTYTLLDCIYKEKHGVFVFVGMVHFA